MTKWALALAGAALGMAAVAVQAATTTMTIVVNSPNSTTVTCTPGTLTAPVAAGVTICPISIAPAGWSGVLSLSGTDAARFALSGTNLVVGGTALTAGSYSVIITATP